MAKVIFFGASSLAKLAHHYFTRDTDHKVFAFTVDAEYRRADSYLGLPLVDSETVVSRFPPEHYKMFVAVGYSQMNTVRSRVYERARQMGYALVSYVSTKAFYLSDAPPGDNAFILEGAVVQPFATIGSNVVLWSGAQVAHDSAVEDHCFIAPGAIVCGDCLIRHHSFLGANSTIRNGIQIAERTLVGAGATVLRHSTPGEVFGSPFMRGSRQGSDKVSI
jgi:sugar O-acyltransferase (sialic acid O-acetyltransferase NeuD family)